MSRGPGGSSERATDEQRWAELCRSTAAVRRGLAEEARAQGGASQRAGLRPLAMLAAAGAAAVLEAAAAPARPVAADGGADQSLFAFTNQDRASNGVGPLAYSGTLQTIGESGAYHCGGISVAGRSYDMIVRNYFSHVIQGCGQYVFSMMAAYGVGYQSAGENIGWSSGFGSAAASAGYINNAFMNSADHRTNILDRAYTRMGVGSDWTAGPWSGAGTYSNVSMFSEEFVQQGAPPPPPPPPPPPRAPAPGPSAAAAPPPATAVYSHNGPVATAPLPPPQTTAPAGAAPTEEPLPIPSPRGAAPLPLEQSAQGLLADSIETALEAYLVD